MNDRSQAVVDATRRWISSIVIGLNLCPFARRVFEEDRIRYVVSPARDEAGLVAGLSAELQLLAARTDPEVETTLLILPHVLAGFLQYNDFLDTADGLLRDLDLVGTVQIASFHPDYQFADTTPDAVENYTNRSPFPMLHLLREESVTAVAGAEEELLTIPERNIATLKKLGIDALLRKLTANRCLARGRGAGNEGF